MPLIGFIYPRGEKPNGQDENFLELRQDNPSAYADIVCKGIGRAIKEAGPCLSAIKTHYTGTPESFAKVVDAAQGLPIVLAGGPVSTTREALQWAYDGCQAGASGTSYGRNVFNSAQPLQMVHALKGIVHADLTVDEAIDMAQILEN
jgi:DhnA family fructose-bisphosphate aldolase class Ia